MSLAGRSRQQSQGSSGSMWGGACGGLGGDALSAIVRPYPCLGPSDKKQVFRRRCAHQHQINDGEEPNQAHSPHDWSAIHHAVHIHASMSDRAAHLAWCADQPLPALLLTVV